MAETFKEVLLGLTGWPLKVSLSPILHGRFLRDCGLEGSYRLFPARLGELDELLCRLAVSGFRGLNVTFPHKRRARQLCHDLADHARDLTAVNTIVFDDGGMTGYNTDVAGFLFLLSMTETEPPYLIAGCGGAAEAVGRALELKGQDASVFCRDPGACSLQCDVRSLNEIGGEIRQHSRCTVINATTLGWSQRDLFPADVNDMRDSVFIDLNYNPSWSWRNQLAGKGARVVTGELMLLGLSLIHI